jgi:hypothetical protein
MSQTGLTSSQPIYEKNGNEIDYLGYARFTAGA